MSGVIAIVPVGNVTKAFCRELSLALGQVLGRELEVLPGLGDPQYAYNPSRDQYHSTAILRRVGMAIHPKKHAMGLGVVDVDLFMPELNFVFGEADRKERAAVVSVARLRPEFYNRPPEPAVTMRRMVAESLHEVGHVLGLPHCQNESCAMFFSNTLSDTDRKRPTFCDACRERLFKATI